MAEKQQKVAKHSPVVREFADGSRTVHIASATRVAKGEASARGVVELEDLVSKTIAQSSAGD
jgi:hypothetical protein